MIEPPGRAEPSETDEVRVTHDVRAIDDERETDDERRLRALLERGVPRRATLGTEQRLARVRGRMLRRRRLRAGVAGVTMGAVATAGLVWLLAPSGSGPGEADGRERLPAASVPEGRSPTVGPGGDVFHYRGLDGLTAQLPSGWTGLASEDSGVDDGSGSPGTPNFAGSRPLPTPKLPCPESLTYCIASRSLRSGDGMAVLRLERDGALLTKPEQPLMKKVTVGKECRLVGGTVELFAWRKVGDSHPRDAVIANACLNHPSVTEVKQLQMLLRTAVFKAGEGQD